MLPRPVGCDHAVDDVVVAALEDGFEDILALRLVELVGAFVDAIVECAAHGVPELDGGGSPSRLGQQQGETCEKA
jgi:hypothetical protein